MTNEFVYYLTQIFNENVLKIVISNKKEKNYKYNKIVLELKSDYYYVSKYTEKQVFNEKVNVSNIISYMNEMIFYFKQYNFFTENIEFMIKISKKNKIFFSKRTSQNNIVLNLNNNREKKYILNEGNKIEPLIDMGIFTSDGHVVNSMYDKFKQINRFLEIIDDALKNKEYKQLNIIDFGCGKSYLTFVVYYYLTEIKNIKANIIGLDLKKDVIDNCNKIAEKYGYTGIKFEVGNINGYEVKCDVDMVITLHACDTATDYALYNAIKWNTKMIFSVPCCQHELNSKIAPNHLKIIKRYGIAKERISALYTDIIRCNLLEIMGYKTKLLEFVDFENTPKNLLIRAYKSNIPKAVKDELLEEVLLLLEELNCDQTLFELLKEQLDKTENL
jgi:SAM-dependent methyltransferase